MVLRRFHPLPPAAVRPLRAVLALAVAASLSPLSAAAQPGVTRKSATVEALVTYPAFFHTQPVRVRGEVREREGALALAGQAREVWLAGPAAGRGAATPGQAVEVTGTLLDPGRLEPGDPRLRGTDVERRSRALLGKPWPGIGELLLLMADDIQDAPPYPSPSVRALALEPDRFTEQVVTLTGRFRGRNLFGDQPNAPGRSRWDFVLASADASVWVTGLRPRGDRFTLDVEARADGNRWIEVTGTVRHARGLVYVEATTIRLARPPSDLPAEPVARVPTQGPPPEILFSTPTDGETDVPPTVVVRIQFSRDLDAATLQGRVAAGYLPATPAGAGQAPTRLTLTATYNEANRSLELRFAQPLEPLRTVIISFEEGIEGTDGAKMAPATLRFTVGG